MTLWDLAAGCGLAKACINSDVWRGRACCLRLIDLERSGSVKMWCLVVVLGGFAWGSVALGVSLINKDAKEYKYQVKCAATTAYKIGSLKIEASHLKKGCKIILGQQIFKIESDKDVVIKNGKLEWQKY